MNNYLSTAGANVQSLKDVIAFNKKNEEKVMPYFKQETLESSETLGPLSDKDYMDAIATRKKVIDLIDNIMSENKLDAICGTSIGLPCMIDVLNGDYSTGFYFCPPAAVAGYPHITVPMGKTHELPAGLSFMARAYQEANIIKLAYAFEQATKKRETPKFIKTSIP